MNFSSLLFIALIGFVWPYERNFDNRLELANEFAILVVFSLLTCQTEYMKDTEGKSLTGWALISIIVLYILVNFGIVIFCDLQTLW